MFYLAVHLKFPDRNIRSALDGLKKIILLREFLKNSSRGQLVPSLFMEIFRWKPQKKSGKSQRES